MQRIARDHPAVQDECRLALEPLVANGASRNNSIGFWTFTSTRTNHVPDKVMSRRISPRYAAWYSISSGETTQKRGIRGKQKNAGLNHVYLIRLLDL